MTERRDNHEDRPSPRTPEDDYEARTFYTPSTGSKICLVVGGGFLALAAYFLLAPTFLTTNSGVLACGTALNPASTEFAKNICAGYAGGNLWRALGAALIGIVVGALGTYLFGGTREEIVREVSSSRRRRRGDDEDGTT